MDKKNIENLVLITNGYPYGAGEAFIENEITYLANAFKQVHIIAAGNSFSSIRPNSENSSPNKLFHYIHMEIPTCFLKAIQQIE